MKSAIAWFARNPVAANLLMVLLIAAGLAALPAIQQKSFPDIDVDMIQIGVPYLGAAPEEVEEGVCIRIEEEIFGIEGIEKITSSAAEGACGVTAELIDGYPVDRAQSEIKNAVDAISTFPVETEKPVINHIVIKRVAAQIAISGDASEDALKVVGEQVRDELASLPGITQVELTNARDYEISVEVSEESLRRYGLTFEQVAEAVRRGSLDRPGGSIKTSTGEVLLRTKGQAYVRDDFQEIVVLTRDDGTRLLLGEVAKIVDGFEEDDRYATFDGEPAVLVKVYRVGDQRVLEVAEKAKAYVKEVAGRLPEGIHATLWRDGSSGLRDRLDILIRNGLSGFVLVFAMLALFLRLRLAIWVSIGVPLSILGAFALFPPLDLSIDVISLFAFILVLGLLVDDAIVVGENVHRHQEAAEEPLHAAITGAQEVCIPVIFGVLTTVVAFLPMLQAPGTMGQIFGTIGIVTMCCLFFSLLESQLVLPAHLGHMRIGSRGRPPREGSVSARWQRVQRALAGSLDRMAVEVYRPALERVIAWRYTAVAVAVAALMLVATLLSAGILKFSFFPPVEDDYVTARLAMPPGTPVEVTARAVEVLEESARRVKEELDLEYPIPGGSVVKHFMRSVGQQPSTGGGTPANANASASASHLGEVTIELLGGNERPLPAHEVVELWRSLTPPIPDVDELVFTSDLFSVGEPINIELKSPDVEQLEAAAEVLKAELAEYPGVFDIGDSWQGGKEEIQLDILPAAETLGITLDDLAAQVRHAFYGAEAQRIQRGRDDVRVMVRYPEEQRRSLADLDNLRIRTPSGGEVPFYAVAKASAGVGYSTIKRADRQRVINVTADVDLSEGNANQILASLREGFLAELVRDHPGMSYSLEGEQREQAEALGALLINYGFALVLIYVLLAVPLRSYAQPLLIMAVIPFGAVGAILGHILMRPLSDAVHNLSMMSVFGIVALSGVVVNSSLVLVHYVNERRGEGAELLDAVRDAGQARFRPIVLTSITTFMGLTPLLLERSVGSAFLKPMGTSLGFGVLFATSISLFLVPSAYVILEDLKELVARRRGASRDQSAEEPDEPGEPEPSISRA